MCMGCSVNGTQAQCPSCRSLATASFPWDASANFEALWGHTFQAFSRDVAMCVVATIIFFAIVMGGQLVATIFSEVLNALLGLKMSIDPENPFGNLRAFIATMAVSQLVGALVGVAAQGVALVGFYRVLIDVLVGKRADLGRMFSQLHLFPKFVVMQVTLFFLVTVPSLLYFGGVGVAGLALTGLRLSSLDDLRPERLLNPALIGLFAMALLVYLCFLVVILPVTLFAVPELVVGQCGPLEALQRAWQLGAGQRLRAFGYSFVAGLVVLAGFAACCIGLLPALPLASMLLLALFLALRNSAGLPPAIHD